MNKQVMMWIIGLAVFLITPVSGINAATISSHSSHTLVLTEDGVISFGKNTYSQLGDGTFDDKYTPVPVLQLPADTIVSVEAGAKHSFVRTEEGRVYAFGSNYSGELGVDPEGGSYDTPAPVLGYQRTENGISTAPLTHIVSLAAGSDHTIAVREDGTLWSWGSNEHHQLGQHSYIPTGTKYIAQQVESDVTFTEAVSYENHNFVLDDEGRVWGFGQNITRMFQTSESRVKNLQLIEGLPPIEEVETGASHVIALDESGNVWTWGYNYFGEHSASPSRIEELSDITDIAVGDSHNLALGKNGRMYGWGENNYGELTGTAELIEPPEEILIPPASITEIEAGKNYSIAKTADGDLYTWGRNDFGQLGDGSGKHQASPVFISMQEVEDVIIKKSRVSLEKGETYQVEATVLPEDARNKTLHWSSSNENIATVEDGMITATGNDPSANEAVITAVSANGKHSDTIRVTLKTGVTGVNIIKNALTLERTWTNDGLSDESYQLEANVYPHSATDKRIIWTTSDPSVVTVDPQGTLHSQKTGEATITATTIDGGYTDTIPIKVTIPVSEIHIRDSGGGISLWEGQRRKLEYFVYPINASNQQVLEWTSSDPDVVSVDYFGNITAHEPGTATVTVTSVDKRKTGSVTITVNKGEPVALSGFSIKQDALDLSARSEEKIETVFYPAGASDKRVSWSSADETIATVDSTGKVRGISSGETVITAITKDGRFERKIKVQVGATESGWVIFPEKTGVSRNKEWNIDFSTELSEDTITEENIYIQDISGKVVESSVSYNHQTVTISPDLQLSGKSYYYLIVNDQVHSASGEPLKNNIHFLFETK